MSSYIEHTGQLLRIKDTSDGDEYIGILWNEDSYFKGYVWFTNGLGLHSFRNYYEKVDEGIIQIEILAEKASTFLGFISDTNEFCDLQGYWRNNNGSK